MDFEQYYTWINILNLFKYISSETEMTTLELHKLSLGIPEV